MPKATIWIKVENQEAWSKLDQKSAFVNALLAQYDKDTSVQAELKEAPVLPVSLNDAFRYNSVPTLKPRSNKFCKEGHPIPEGRDRCLGKGCKYG